MDADGQHRKHCLVTGASGYIGRALVAELVESGAEVTALVRKESGSSGLGKVRYVTQDLAAGDVALPLDGVDQVFHLAGVAHQHASSETYARVNVEATERLARQAAAAGVRRFIFFSSVKANRSGSNAPGALGPDSSDSGSSDQPADMRLDYGHSKALAEHRLLDVHETSGMELVLLRPALVYSAHAPGHLDWLRRWVAAGLPAPPVGGARSMIARADLVRLCVDIMKHTRLDKPVALTLTDGEAYSVRRMHGALCEALGRRPMLPSPPAPLWRMAAAAMDAMRGQPRGTTWQRIAGTELSEAAGYEVFDFEPRLSFEHSLEQGT